MGRPSPPPLLGSAVPTPLPAIIVAQFRSVPSTPSIGCVDQYCNVVSHWYSAYTAGLSQSRKYIASLFQPGDPSISAHTLIYYIANNPVRAKAEIVALPDRERKFKHNLLRKEMKKELDSNS